MHAMILAAGQGKRMLPLTTHCPKCLLTVAGKPLIVRHLLALKDAGITQVVINICYLASKIETYLGDGQQFGMKIIYSKETTGLETAGGIANALPLLADHFLVINADVWTDYPLRQLFTPPTQQAHLVLTDNPSHHPKGDFSLHHNRVTMRSQPSYTFTGLACYRRVFFNTIAAGVKAPLKQLLLPAIAQGYVTGEYYHGIWHDVGTPERLQALNAS